VLVADEEDDAAALVQPLLTSDDRVATVGRARHGRKALTVTAAAQPDVILMDLHMPVMGGTTPLQRTEGLRGPQSLYASEDVATGHHDAGRMELLLGVGGGDG
jgi:CheY-like chemotaxis protein